MPKKPPKNSNWVQLTKNFVKEWPEVLEGLEFQNMPVKYLEKVTLILKNCVTIVIDIRSQMTSTKFPLSGPTNMSKTSVDRQQKIAKFLHDTIKTNYYKIKHVELKFDIPALKKDMESKTSAILQKTFQK